MKIAVLPDYPSLCRAVADRVAGQLMRKPESVLVFPTGNTPLGLFKLLVESHRERAIDFSNAHVVILDEYAALAPGDPRSLAGWLKRELLMPIGITPSRIHGFENGPDNLEKKIAQLGGLDLVILGLGPNGHLGFNEPGSPFDSRARRIELTPDSITSNAAYWGSEDQVPRHGFTLGLGTIAAARGILLMVSGCSKAAILAAAMRRPPSPEIPATMLRGQDQAMILADGDSVVLCRDECLELRILPS